MNCSFQYADLLIPPMEKCDKWAVIACDQHTSDPDFWMDVRKQVGVAPSALSVILPEVELPQMNDARVDAIHSNMRDLCNSTLFNKYPNSFVYVERSLQDGSIRQGVVGVIDLERYQIPPCGDTTVFATEKTVPERLPPRARIRRNACLDLSHVVVFCDDQQAGLIEPLAEKKEQLPKLYDFDLMSGGGHIAGWLLSGACAEAFQEQIRAYERDHIYLVGDGNHSLLAAKRCFEELKAADPQKDWAHSPARFAMVELENIHSPAMVFEPIHRVITDTDAPALVKALQSIAVSEGTPVTVLSGTETLTLNLPVGDDQLIVGVVQDFLDRWLQEHPGQVDYIHGKQVLEELAAKPDTVGILLPDFDKKSLFPYIRKGNITPRKTFSIGHASEKRYYLEGRQIL